jgi:hypothetical protein
MVQLTFRRYGSLVAGLAVLILGLPADAHAAVCLGQPLAQRFLPWHDPGWYASVPDGGFEKGAASWTLAGGAAAVEGNEPYHVGNRSDHQSLALPSGASATSPAMCISTGHPTLRFFARNNGSRAAALTLSAVFRDLSGRTQTVSIGAITAGEWAPTPLLPVVFNALSPVSTQSIAFRFAPADDRGRWRIDDVYVDPYGKG